MRKKAASESSIESKTSEEDSDSDIETSEDESSSENEDEQETTSKKVRWHSEEPPQLRLLLKYSFFRSS